MKKKKYMLVPFIVILCSCFIFLGYYQIFMKASKADIVCSQDSSSGYVPSLYDNISDRTIKTDNSNAVLSRFENNVIAVEAFDTQANPYLQIGKADYWYPHYMATVIIAVDKDKTDSKINGWYDLLSVPDVVNISNTYNYKYSLLAISRALDGPDFQLDQCMFLLSKLNNENRLILDETIDIEKEKDQYFANASVAIMFDYQAASLIKSGRNIEIVVPVEGTLTFVKGLLSTEKLVIDEEKLESDLINAGYRLANGNCDQDIYPDASVYDNAKFVTNTKAFSQSCKDISGEVSRYITVAHQNLADDGQGNIIYYLILLIIIISWGASLVLRIVNKGIQKGLLYIVYCLLFGVIIHCVYVLLSPYDITRVSRLLWYSYFLPELLVPVLGLLVAWSINQLPEKNNSTLWFNLAFSITLGLFLLVLTNDYHHLIFIFPINGLEGQLDYQYGQGFWIILVWVSSLCFGNLAMLFSRCWRSPVRWRICIPCTIVVIMVIYCILYIQRVDFIFNTEMGFIIDILILLYWESCLGSGLMPSNIQYVKVFKAANMNMQILKHDLSLAYKAGKATPLDSSTKKLIAEQKAVTNLLIDEHILISSKPVHGGYAVWQKDTRNLKQLKEALEMISYQIYEDNEILTKENQVKGGLLEIKWRNIIYNKLENAVGGEMATVRELISSIPQTENPEEQQRDKYIMAKLNLLICYIKRKMNLLLISRNNGYLLFGDITQACSESLDSAKAAGIDGSNSNSPAGLVLYETAMIFYDYFQHLLDKILPYNGSFIFWQFVLGENKIRLVIFVDIELEESISSEYFSLSESLLSQIRRADGLVKIEKNEDDNQFNFVLEIPKGDDISE